MPGPDYQNLSPEQLEAVAGLIGTAAKQLKDIDGKVTESNPNIKGLKFSPKDILKEVVQNNTPVGNHPPAPQPVYTNPPVVHPPGIQTPPELQYRQFTTTPQPVQMVVMDTVTVQQFKDSITLLSQQIDDLTKKVINLTSIENQVLLALENTLKSGVKSITIKLDDNTNKKQESVC